MDEASPMSSNNFTVISTAPSNFAGAATVHARALGLFSEMGSETVFVSINTPFRIDELITSSVRVVVPLIRSDAYPTSDAIQLLAVVREIMKEAQAAVMHGRGKIVLLGTYLFPFYQAIELASRLLADE